MKNKKTMIAMISVVALLLVLIGVTYAYWIFTKSQQTDNLITSACLDITLDNESEAISLGNQFPISDEEGMQTTPYTFTVTNNCNTSIDYQIALESLGNQATALKPSSIKVALDDSFDLLSNKATTEPTITGTYQSNKIGYGTLAPAGSAGASVTHNLRIWIDYDAPVSEMNKTFESKISVTVGQNVVSPYEEGTLAYDILKNNGGAGVEELDATEFKHAVVYSGPAYVDSYDSLYFATEYVYNENSNNYYLSGDIVQATIEECRSETKECGRYSFFSYIIEEQLYYIYEVIDWNNPDGEEYVTANHIQYMKNFTFVTPNDEAGLYKTEDDLGTSYYYRGNVTNNYVQFGSYPANSTINGTTFNTEVPMYWRIVRINGDGTVRLVYDGTTKVENSTSHTSIVGNSPYNHVDYINVNYGDSDIKDVVDEWYNTNLKTNYGRYIADGIFCNDKEISKITYLSSDWYETTPDNASFVNTSYEGGKRLSNKVPSLNCTRKEDRYTTTMALGNGLLKHPIGLLTLDEVVFAGGMQKENIYFINNSYYLYSGNNFGGSTPSFIEDTIDDSPVEDSAGVFIVDSDGYISSSYYLYSEYGIRPVINLRADVEFTGDGSFENPYIIITN